MKYILSFLIAILLPLAILSQTDTVFNLSFSKKVRNKYGENAIILDKYWKYHAGDSLRWADTVYNDSDWKSYRSKLSFKLVQDKTFESTGWFRLRIHLDTSCVGKFLGISISQMGASEVYVDGKLVQSFGKINTAVPALEEYMNPQFLPFPVFFTQVGNHLIAVRYSRNKTVGPSEEEFQIGFEMKVNSFWESGVETYTKSTVITSIFVFYFTFFFALSFLHILFFFFYRPARANLYYSIFTASFGFVFLAIVVFMTFLNPETSIKFMRIRAFMPDFYSTSLLAMLYYIFNKKIPKIFWLWFVLFAVDFVLTFFNYDFDYFTYALVFILFAESLRIIIVSIVKKREGAWIIGIGVLISILFFTIVPILMGIFGQDLFTGMQGVKGVVVGLITLISTISIPLSMSVYMASDFAKTNKKLTKKLEEVEELSAKTISQQKEKQELLATQNIVLEQKVKERTQEVVKQKVLLEIKNTEVTDSINYARTIQLALIPSEEKIKKNFVDAFVFYRPKDIVSGDFYWIKPLEQNGVLIAVADCTGHGVPGALMSILSMEKMNEASKQTDSPSQIIHLLHKNIKSTLLNPQSEDSATDGMDIALCKIVQQSETNFNITFSGAARPLWILRKNAQAIEEYKSSIYSIGGILNTEDNQFPEVNIHLGKGDRIYMSSDGFADQFNEKGKKLMIKAVRELILSIQPLSLVEQKAKLEFFFENWKGNSEQTDDVLLLGFQL